MLHGPPLWNHFVGLAGDSLKPCKYLHTGSLCLRYEVLVNIESDIAYPGLTFLS
jgi:hypothetical protein